MSDKYKRDLKKILVYLFDQFYKDDIVNANALITKELLEKQIDSSKEKVNGYLKEHRLKITDYRAFTDKNYPKSYLFNEIPILVIPKWWKPDIS